MPNPELLEKYLRFPIIMVPDPWGRDESYARHHEVDVEKVLPEVGIYPEFIYQAQRYRSGTYASSMRRALEMREHLKTILDKYRDEDHKIQGEWWPISVFCSNCNRDTTEIDDWDGEWGLSYHCETCGFLERVTYVRSREQSSYGESIGLCVGLMKRSTLSLQARTIILKEVLSIPRSMWSKRFMAESHQ